MKPLQKISGFLLTGIILYLSCLTTVAQNVAITDDDGYSAKPSAMLDVKSDNKGILIPRLTSLQRSLIADPETGLMVFDSDINHFFYFNGAMWVNIASALDTIWAANPTSVYLYDPDLSVGIGTATPAAKLEVKANPGAGINDAIFNVINSNGDTVLAVYEQGVRINVADSVGVKATSNRGGFAVGGFSVAKGVNDYDYLRVTPDSVRIYIQQDVAKATGNKGGFAVGGFSQVKGTTDDYMYVTDDSTRLWTYGAGGFRIHDIASSSADYLNLSPSNYFIGHYSGSSMTSGIYNSFIGYKSGYFNNSGSYNTFMGYYSGYQNQSGNYDTYLGYQAGMENTIGSFNAFIGYGSGYSNTTGSSNVFIGHGSGHSNTEGWSNNFVGESAGYMNSTGTNNIFIGNQAGYSNTISSGNIFLGRDCGYRNTTGYGNLMIGNMTGNMNNNGNSNVYLGGGAFEYDTVGSNNVAVGVNSGNRNYYGENNTFVGMASGYNNNGSGNVFIGYLAGYSEVGSNKLYISNSSTSTPLIYGDFNSDNIVINGNFKTTGMLYDASSIAGNNGQVLSSTGSGTSWIDIPSSWQVSGSNIYYNSGNVGINQSNPVHKLHSETYLNSAETTNNMLAAVFGQGKGDTDSQDEAFSGLYGNALVGQSNWDYGYGVLGKSTEDLYGGIGVLGTLEANVPAISGDAGVVGRYSPNYYGMLGINGLGIKGMAIGTGSQNATAVYAFASSEQGQAYGIYAEGNTTAGSAYAGYFQGNVHVNGTLSKSAGTFRIDHPLDPANKYLSHSFVESPDMKNIYDGTVIIDNDGKAIVLLPDYFDALNKEFRYQLTCIGGYAPVFIESEIITNSFVIAGGNPGMKVSWQVTGVRKDPYAVHHPVIVEEEKTDSQKGKYLNPELYNQSGEKRVFPVTEINSEK